MKKQWIVLPLLLCFVSVSNAQEAEAEAAVEQNQGIAAAETTGELTTNIQAFASEVGYTYVKDEVTYASPMALFEVKGTDEQSGLDKIFVSVDSGEFALYKGPISFETEGPHSLVYRFVDKVGNVSESKVFNIYVDATAPRVLEPVFTPSLYTASGKNYVGLKNQISFKYFDDLTGVAFIEKSVNSNDLARYEAPFSPEDLGLSNSGAFVLNYQATDMVSNVTALKKQNLYLDATAPTVNIFAKVVEIDGIKYISPKDVIQVEAVDAETKVQKIMFAVNEGEYAEYDPAIGIRITKPGEYDVKAKASDVVGNTSEEVVFSVVIDALSPKGDAAYTTEIPAVEVINNAPPAAAVETPAEAAPPVAEEAVNTEKPEGSVEVPAGTQAPALEDPAQAN